MRKSRRKSVRKSLRKRSRRRSRRRSSKRKSIKRKGFKPPVKGWYIITREGCPYCKDAKNLLESKGQKYKSLDITISNREKIYRDVDVLTKTYRYVPMVFKDGKFIGGFSELKTYI
jgi:glutaredoxin